ncbi:MxaK protein [Methylobacterium sp. NEAU 140]|uniref:MxaK protein n=1 Tax=Methylobacterium sp. NEAU 140 TaxID=3064945 RepID=UPI0027328A6C|nr:MxaK protein [Methylobacterium sp. NEAU 140]MDP4021376.1 MxaK protein [Methylobacterium sp. NEAU 140]
MTGSADAPIAPLRRAWRRARPSLLLVLPILLALAALGFGAAAWRAERTNRTIAALDAGEDAAVAPDAPVPLLVARVRFLAARDRLEETEPLVAALDRAAAPEAAARARYLVANARVRDAFARIARSDLDKAGPQVTLARQDYRRALRDRPDFWDAKFNLDVASRLIRDFPEFDRTSGDEMRAEPKQIWTDIPGQPRGGP